MSRTLVVALFGLCAWAAIVDAQANKAATVSHYAPPRTPWVIPISRVSTRTSTS